MRHTEVKRLAQEIGNALQDAAETAASVVLSVGEPENWESLDDWRASIEYDGEELVSALDLLATQCAEASVAIDAALRGNAAVPS